MRRPPEKPTWLKVLEVVVPILVSIPTAVIVTLLTKK